MTPALIVERCLACREDRKLCDVAPAAEAAVAGETAAQKQAPSCPPHWMSLLLALGVLFGFSERAFTSILANFEENFATKARGKKTPAATPPPRPAPPSGRNGATTTSGGKSAPVTASDDAGKPPAGDPAKALPAGQGGGAPTTAKTSAEDE
jgi:hypothetical protein